MQALASSLSVGGGRPKTLVQAWAARTRRKFFKRDPWNEPRVEPHTMTLAALCGIDVAHTRVHETEEVNGVCWSSVLTEPLSANPAYSSWLYAQPELPKTATSGQLSGYGLEGATVWRRKCRDKTVQRMVCACAAMRTTTRVTIPGL